MSFLGDTAELVKKKASETVQSAQNIAQGGKDTTGSYMQQAGKMASQTAKSALDTAQAGKENTGTYLQQVTSIAQGTGEKVMSAAQGAADTVTNTLGLGGGKHDKT